MGHAARAWNYLGIMRSGARSGVVRFGLREKLRKHAHSCLWRDFVIFGEGANTAHQMMKHFINQTRAESFNDRSILFRKMGELR